MNDYAPLYGKKERIRLALMMAIGELQKVINAHLRLTSSC